MNTTRQMLKAEGRRTEFMDAAEALFNEKGFESTSVEDIVQRVGVAKGLFYYYFETKEELMSAMVARITDAIDERIEGIIARTDLSAMEKFAAVLESNKLMKESSRELMRWFRQERNRALHHAMEEKATDRMVPVLESIVRQGVEEGIFSTPYPRESAIAMLSMFRGVSREKVAFDDPEKIDELAKVLGFFLDRLLDAEQGTFQALFMSTLRDLADSSKARVSRS